MSHVQPVQLTLVYLVSGKDALLSYSILGLTKGYYTGAGGKIEPDETPEAGAIREVKEEVGVDVAPEALRYAGTLHVHWLSEIDGLNRPGASEVLLYVYVATEWSGEPQPTEAFGYHKYYPIADLPFDRMMPTDRNWVRPLLEGQYLTGELWCYKKTNERGERIIVLDRDGVVCSAELP